MPRSRANVASASPSLALPSLALALGLVLTAAATRYAARLSWEHGREHFDDAADTAAAALRRRMDEYGAMLRATRGLFVASTDVSHDEFSAYVNALSLVRHYPGIQGIGYAPRLLPTEVPAHEARALGLGIANYHVWPPATGPEVYPVTYLEPGNARNNQRIGYDLASDAGRREGIDRVIRVGGLCATARLPPPSGLQPDPQLTFMLFLALTRPHHLPGTRDVVGLVFGDFRMSDLIAGVLGPPRSRSIDLSVYDGDHPDPALQLYTDPAIVGEVPAYERLAAMDVGGHRWTLQFHSRMGERSLQPRAVPWLTAAFGMVVSALLFMISRAQVRARVAAEAHAEDIRIALEARDVFLGIASHELRTPVTTLRLQLDRLTRLARSENAPTLGDPGVRNALEMLQRQERRLGRLVEDLLDHLRIATGGLHLALDSVDLADVAREVVERRADEAQRAGSVVTLDAQHTVVGRWDRLRVDQVVTNLLGNAIKYGAGKPVTVRVLQVEDHARLIVRDEGIGIAPGDVARIFGRFERAAPTQNYGGFGLGLYIVREVVEALGGTITVVSTPGEGATFTVDLPLNPPVAA